MRHAAWMNAELLGKVRGPEYVGDLPYLRLWISRLRAKIDHNPTEHSVVRTFPGIGHMLTTKSTPADHVIEGAGVEITSTLGDMHEGDDLVNDPVDTGDEQTAKPMRRAHVDDGAPALHSTTARARLRLNRVGE